MARAGVWIERDNNHRRRGKNERVKRELRGTERARGNERGRDR